MMLGHKFDMTQSPYDDMPDVLGKLNLSDQGMFDRDFYVLCVCAALGVPVATVVGGLFRPPSPSLSLFVSCATLGVPVATVVRGLSFLPTLSLSRNVSRARSLCLVCYPRCSRRYCRSRSLSFFLSLSSSLNVSRMPSLSLTLRHALTIFCMRARSLSLSLSPFLSPPFSPIFPLALSFVLSSVFLLPLSFQGRKISATERFLSRSPCLNFSMSRACARERARSLSLVCYPRCSHRHTR